MSPNSGIKGNKAINSMEISQIASVLQLPVKILTRKCESVKDEGRFVMFMGDIKNDLVKEKFDNDIDLLNASDIEFIPKDVSFALHKMEGINKVINADIYKLLESECREIYYLIEENEICAFYRKVD